MTDKFLKDKYMVALGHAVGFATMLYNETDYDKNTIISQLHMGDKRYDYVLPEDQLPKKLTDDDVYGAFDNMFQKMGWGKALDREETT